MGWSRVELFEQFKVPQDADAANAASCDAGTADADADAAADADAVSPDAAHADPTDFIWMPTEPFESFKALVSNPGKTGLGSKWGSGA